MQQFLDRGDDRPRALENPEHTPDDEDEEDDVRRLLHAAGDCAQEAEEADRLCLVGRTAAEQNPAGREIFFNPCIRSRHHHRPFADTHLPLLALVLPRRHNIGQERADKNHRREQDKHMGKPGRVEHERCECYGRKTAPNVNE